MTVNIVQVQCFKPVKEIIYKIPEFLTNLLLNAEKIIDSLLFHK